VRWIGLLLTLAACNAVFGNDKVETEVPDLRLLKPPLDTPAECPSPPDFSTWKISQNDYWGKQVLHPSFLSERDVVFNYQDNFYEGDVDGTPAQITSLDDNTGADFFGAAAAPGGDLFWFARSASLGSGLYYAVRDGAGWTPHAADFGIVLYGLEPGSAGFYGSEVRMVAAVQPMEVSHFGLVELTSLDGTTWTNLGPLPFDTPTLTDQYYDPVLTPDGCVLLFARDQLGIEVSLRGTDGTFGAPTPFPGAPVDSVQPAISADESIVWFDSPTAGQLQARP
jgi:hypothetical protein